MVNTDFFSFVIFWWALYSFILVFLLFFLAYIISFWGSDVKEEEKLSAYECGFDPFEASRTQIHTRFIIIAILFLLFDLEIAYFLPLIVILNQVTLLHFSYICFFIYIVCFGFIFEWSKNILNWNQAFTANPAVNFNKS